MPEQHPIILIVGPTAGGKTRVAIELAKALGGRQKGTEARRHGGQGTGDREQETGGKSLHPSPLPEGEGEQVGGEIISCDSMQVYRGMDIGTAKPTAGERAEAPHHLIDIADPYSPHPGPLPGGEGEFLRPGPFPRGEGKLVGGFTVDRWLALAEEAVADIRVRGRWPIVVGGTNLYVQALLWGLDPGPPPQEKLRTELQRLSDVELHTRLDQVDPDSAKRIHPNDRKRMIRAIEVFESTGRPISELQTHWGRCVEGQGGGRAAGPAGKHVTGQVGGRGDVILIGLDYPVETINRRINARVKWMIEEGLVEEVKRLNAPPHGPLGPQAREALGYKQILDHLDGRISLEEAIEQIKIRTRRFAKQQRTWLRRFRLHEPAIWIDAAELSAQGVARQALAFILARTMAAYSE